MNRTFAILPVFFCLLTCLPSCWRTTPGTAVAQDSDSLTIKEFFNKEGILHSRVSMYNGIPQGPSVSYYTDGNINTEVDYVNGKKEGIEKKYYGTGELYRERPYVQGIMNGWERRYYKSGQKMAEVYYKDGNPGTDLKEYKHHGELISRYPSITFSLLENRDYYGQLVLQIRFSDGSKSGRFYLGPLLEGKYFDKNAPVLPSHEGIAEIPLQKPVPGQKYTISGMMITNQSTPYVSQNTFVLKGNE